MAAKSSRREGFTMVEVVVGVAVGTCVLLMTWGLVHLATRAFGTARKKLTNLQAASLLIEFLEQDLRNLYYHPTRGIEVDASRGHELRFYVFDEAASRLEPGRMPSLAVKRVVYAFDPKENRVYRGETGKGRRALHGAFESVVFSFLPPAISPAGEVTFNNCFRVEITCATERELALNRDVPSAPSPKRQDRNVFTIVSTCTAGMKAMQNHYPMWQPSLHPRLPGNADGSTS